MSIKQKLLEAVGAECFSDAPEVLEAYSKDFSLAPKGTPDYVVKQGLKHLGRRPSVVVGKQYKFFAVLTKRVLSRATGAWLFGVLMQIAFSNRTLLGPRGDQQSVAGANPTSLTHVPTS